jgi:hypothetical protein
MLKVAIFIGCTYCGTSSRKPRLEGKRCGEVYMMSGVLARTTLSSEDDDICRPPSLKRCSGTPPRLQR